MKKIIGLSLIAALALSTNVSAEDTKFKVSGNAAFTTNYLWRGISYTDGTVAAQAGIDMDSLFNLDGLHFNLWGSGIKEGSEIDTNIGYTISLGKDMALDIAYIHYNYTRGSVAGSFSGPSYGELYANLSMGDYGITVYEENDFDGTTFQGDASFGPVDISAGYYLVPSDTTSNGFFVTAGVNWDCQLLPGYGMNAMIAYNNYGTATDNNLFGLAGTEGYAFALTLSKDF